MPVPYPPSCSGVTLQEVHDEMEALWGNQFPTDSKAYSRMFIKVDAVDPVTKQVTFSFKSRTGYKVIWNNPLHVWPKCHSTIITNGTTLVPAVGAQGYAYFSTLWLALQPPDRVKDVDKPKYPLDLAGTDLIPPLEVTIRRLWALIEYDRTAGGEPATYRGTVELSSEDIMKPTMADLVGWEAGTPVSIPLTTAAQNILGDRTSVAPQTLNVQLRELWASFQVKAPNPACQNNAWYVMDLTDENFVWLPTSTVRGSTTARSILQFTGSGAARLGIDPDDADYWTSPPVTKALFEYELSVATSDTPRPWPPVEWKFPRRPRGAGFSAVDLRRAHLENVTRLLRGRSAR